MRRTGSPIADHRSSSTVGGHGVATESLDVFAEAGDVEVPSLHVLAVLLLEHCDLPPHLPEAVLDHADSGTRSSGDQVEGDLQRGAGRIGIVGVAPSEHEPPRRVRLDDGQDEGHCLAGIGVAPGQFAGGTDRRLESRFVGPPFAHVLGLADHLVDDLRGGVHIDLTLDRPVLHVCRLPQRLVAYNGRPPRSDTQPSVANYSLVDVVDY